MVIITHPPRLSLQECTVQNFGHLVPIVVIKFCAFLNIQSVWSAILENPHWRQP
jgi:hypothetical protein